MRIAFVQGAAGLEAVEDQVARLCRLAPDRYHIETHAPAAARQRLVELLDGLRVGDELCLASLDPLALEAGDAAQVLIRILERGANLMLIDERQSVLDFTNAPDARRAIEALAALHRRRQRGPVDKGVHPAQTLLTDAEIADIRRLSEAGLSPRRIGLIYRRSPRCISDLLLPTGDAAVGVSQRRA